MALSVSEEVGEVKTSSNCRRRGVTCIESWSLLGLKFSKNSLEILFRIPLGQLADLERLWC